MKYDWNSMRLYHYYDLSGGPFKNLSDLPLEEAERVQNHIRECKIGFASNRFKGYIRVRRELELKARAIFSSKGGKPERRVPQYMTLGKCDWLLDWYDTPRALSLSLANIDPAVISFTYGDLFPTMRYNDGKAYRKQVYMLSEIKGIVEHYGLPQDWNKDGKYGPERYVEVQIWSDKVLQTKD